MASQQLRTAAGADAGSKVPRALALLEQSVRASAQALPSIIKPEHLIRVVTTGFRLTPKLAECSPESFVGATLTLAQMGLVPWLLGQAYIVPYAREAQAIPGWKGMQQLILRSGQGNITTGAVYEGDEFDFALGTRPRLEHKTLANEDDPRKIKYFYAIGHINGVEEKIIEVWSAERVANHRDRYNKVGKAHYSFQNWEMYGRKIPFLQVVKYMPISIENAYALNVAQELSYRADRGYQGLNTRNAIDGSWLEAPVLPAPAEPAAAAPAPAAPAQAAPAQTKPAPAKPRVEASSPPAPATEPEPAAEPDPDAEPEQTTAPAQPAPTEAKKPDDAADLKAVMQGFIATMRSTKSDKEMNACWRDIATHYKGNVPIEIEAARNDHAEELRARTRGTR